MRNASAAFLNHIGEAAHIKASLYTAAGELTELDEDAFMDGLSFTGGSSPLGEFNVGGCVAGCFDFRLNNFGGEFDSFDFGGAYIDPVVYYADAELAMGRYYFASHKSLGSVIVCTAYDALRLMDMERFEPSYPLSAQSAVLLIAENHGLTYVDFPGSDVMLDDPGTTLTERQALSHIAAITGNYVKVTPMRELVLEWYGGTPIEQETIFSQEIDVADIAVTGVRYGDTQAGADGYVIDLGENPYINDDNAAEIVQRVFSRIGDTTFRGGTVTVLSNPAIEGGDRISFEDDSGETITTIVTYYVYGLGVTMEASCEAQSIGESDLRTRYSGPTGADGIRGTGIYKITTAPSSYKTQTGGFTPSYRIALATATSQSGASEIIVGDVLEYSYYHYPVGYVDGSYVYLGARTSIRGATGAAGPQGPSGDDAIAIAIISSAGIIFKNSTGSTTLTAHVYVGGEEVTGAALAALGTIRWYKDGGSTAVGTGASLTVSASDVDNTASYEARLES